MNFSKHLYIQLSFGLGLIFCGLNSCESQNKKIKKSPNVLFAIADDQSYPHAGVYGFSEINTPGFDHVANSGVLFHNAFVAAPQCSPSRAAILTGKNIWELEEAGTHGSAFPNKFKVFTEELENHGYFVGFTGKPWGPGNWQISGRKQNPVGTAFNKHVLSQVPTKGIRPNNYIENFKDFFSKKEEGAPFMFWFGAHEPHRVYEYGTGVKAGKDIDAVRVPAFLPDTEIVRNDILDYLLEIEHFDSHLFQMISFLKEKGELDNTFIVVTADNGMPFPYAKANLQEFGTHVPLAISMPKIVISKKQVHEPVGLIDIAPTILELVNLSESIATTGKSLMPLLTQEDHPKHREFVLTGRERHTHARPDNLGYPARAIRTEDFLYVYNFDPDRWPAGDPVPRNPENDKRNSVAGFKGLYPGYQDVDASPSKTIVMELENSQDNNALFELAFSKRPQSQLYDIKSDPYCTIDLSNDVKFESIKIELHNQLMEALKAQGDPRAFGNPIFDSYPRYSSMRNFPGFNKRGTYNEMILK